MKVTLFSLTDPCTNKIDLIYMRDSNMILPHMHDLYVPIFILILIQNFHIFLLQPSLVYQSILLGVQYRNIYIVVSYSNVILQIANIESNISQKSDLNFSIMICVVIHHYWTDIDPWLDDVEMTSIENENGNIVI